MGLPTFGELEAAIMDRIWTARSFVTVRDVLEGLDRHPAPAYTTVQTVMDILYRKGWLTRSKRGRINVYEATAGREEYVSGLMNEALSKADDRAAVLLRFVQDMDSEEVSQLRRLLDEAAGAPGDGAKGSPYVSDQDPWSCR